VSGVRVPEPLPALFYSLNFYLLAKTETKLTKLVWVILANLIPRSEFEESYSKKFKSKNRRGAPSLSVRIALGSLIIKDELESSDIETIQQL
jgi:hypothetical protein